KMTRNAYANTSVTNDRADWTSSGMPLSGAIRVTSTDHPATRPLRISRRRTIRLGTIGVTMTEGSSEAMASGVASDGCNAAPTAINASVTTAIIVIVRSRVSPDSREIRVATQTP